MGAQELTIKNLAGLNLRDEADLVQDNEFVQLQNVWQTTKGVYSSKLGSVSDIPSASIPLASRVSGVWRHNTAGGKNISIYHCIPDATIFPDNTQDLVLSAGGSGGNLFGGGAATTLRFCYSWIGRSLEQSYNSKNRAGFPAPGSFPLDAWANPAHQSITPTATQVVTVTVPAFPTGVTGANIFMSRGSSTQMVYAGTVTTSGGSLVVSEFVGLSAAFTDPIAVPSQPYQIQDPAGLIIPGTYYIGWAWFIDTNAKEGVGINVGNVNKLSAVSINLTSKVSVSGNMNAIVATAPTTNSTNGAQALYCFIGTQDSNNAPMICVGIVRVGTTITIKSIPAHNAQSAPFPISGVGVVPGRFLNQVNDGWQGGFNYSVGGSVQSRFGFMLAKDSNGLRELHASRTQLWNMSDGWAQQIYAGDSFTFGTTADIHNYAPAPKTQNDKYQSTFLGGGFTQPYKWQNTVNDPMFCYHLGLSYFANGADIPWLTDGYCLAQLTPIAMANPGVSLPPLPKYIFEYQQSLIACGADNQMYGSNASAPQNWATGGSGPLLRFVTIGDALGGGVTAAGVFTPITEATNNPGSFLIGFKKNSTWMVNTIPDPSSSTMAGLIGGQIPASMNQVSGRAGCVAYRSVCQVPQGTMFLGQDACVYLVNAVREPTRIGLKIQNLLLHLVGNDAAMRSCAAVFHDRHYKLSYPSPAAAAVSPVVNDMELWADLRTDEQTPVRWNGPHIGRNIGAQVVLNGDGDDQSRLVCDAALVRTYITDSAASITDLDPNGNPQTIVIQIKSKNFRIKETVFKRFFGAILDMWINYGYSNTVNFEGFSDSNYNNVQRQLSVGNGAVWDSSQFDGSNFADQLWQGFSFNFAQNNLIGRTFQWRLTKSDQAPFVLASVTLLLKTEKRRINL